MLRRWRTAIASGCLWAIAGCGGHSDAQGGPPKAMAQTPAPTSKPAPAVAANVAPAPAAAPNADAQAMMFPDYKVSRNLMGTIIAFTVVGEPHDKAAPACEAALDEIARLEAVLSEWRPDSEISQINAAAGEHPVKVGKDTLEVVKSGRAIAQWSQGAFDLTWAALRGMYLFQPGKETVPELAEVKKRLPLIDYRKVKIDERASTIMLAKRGMALGTGGIAKGYALDKAGDVLLAAGIENFMIFGGGQIELHGTRSGRPWRVGVQHPRREDYFGFVEATSGSVATAGDYEHSFIRDGKRWHHIIDTKTGLPVEHTMAVTVVADSGLAADAVDTALFVLGPERALKLLPKAPFKADALIVDRDLRLHMSPGMVKRLVMRTELVDGKLPAGE